MKLIDYSGNHLCPDHLCLCPRSAGLRTLARSYPPVWPLTWHLVPILRRQIGIYIYIYMYIYIYIYI